MATLAQIRTAVDAKLANLWPQIQAKQDAYAAAHSGLYWQGLRSHTVLPADGVETLPDVGTATPTNHQGDPWPAAIRSTAMPMSLQLDVYDGPLGVGYVATVQVRVNGTVYERSAQVGPESWRTVAWHVVDESVV